MESTWPRTFAGTFPMAPAALRLGTGLAGIALLFTGVAFKSVMVPLRSISTIILTLAFTYGLTSLIYNVRPSCV